MAKAAAEGISSVAGHAAKAREGEVRGAARAAHALSAIIYASLLALLPLSAAPYGAAEAWWAALFVALVFLLAALWAAEGAVSGGWLRREHLLTLPGLALAAFALLQSLKLPGGEAISFDPYETRLTAARVFAVTLYAALLLRYLDTERRLKALVYVVICTGVAFALFGIARQTGQREEWGFIFLPLLRRGTGYAQFINRNHFAYLAEMSLGLTLGLIAGRGVTRQKVLICAAAALPVWAALILSNSRGGVFAMLCQIVFLAATFGAARSARGQDREEGASFAERLAYSRAARIALAVLLLAAVVVGAAWIGGDQLADRMGTVRDEVGAAKADPGRVSRADIWEDSWMLAKKHPLVGVGVGGYWIAIRSAHKGSGTIAAQQAHNDYLELLASAGVIGACLFLGFLFLFVRRARARLRRGTPFARAAALGALAGLFGVAVHSLVDFGPHLTGNALVFAALVAVASANARPATGHTKN